MTVMIARNFPNTMLIDGDLHDGVGWVACDHLLKNVRLFTDTVRNQGAEIIVAAFLTLSELIRDRSSLAHDLCCII